MIDKTLKLLALLASVALLGGCMTARQMTYLWDFDYDKEYPAVPAPEITVRPGDMLSITIASENAELAAPFNFMAGSGTGTNAAQVNRYPVDAQGNINFPLIGEIHLGGKTLAEARDEIAQSISGRGYIKNPLVKLSLDNFTVTVIGKSSNTILSVTDPSINLLQVIARSGGTPVESKITDVMVIRTEGDTRKAYSVNLRKKALFDSPVFYLQQNDIVYLKPEGSSLSSEGQTVMTFVGTGLSLASIIANIILWTRVR